MYVVVGCRSCDALWIVEGRPDTTGCPRCGSRHRFDRLRALAEADTVVAARQARSRLIADRQGRGDALADVGPWDEAEDRAGDPVVPDEEYLGAAGLDPDAVEGAATAPTRGRAAGPRAVVEDALRTLDEPAADDVVERAVERGVPAERARRILARLVRAGAATERDGVYRLL